MKLRTAIVEDQKPDAERLEQLLKKAFGEEEILCRRFVCGDDFLKEFPGEGYQVVFLDICMEGTNGIETARQLRAADPELLIVFVTSSPEYVWDAFPVHPFDYLLKPYKEEKFDHLAGAAAAGAGGAHCPPDRASAAEKDPLCHGPEPFCKGRYR